MLTLITLASAVSLAIPGHAKAGTYVAWYCADRDDKSVIGAERDWSGNFGGLGYQPYPIVSCPGDPGVPSGAIATAVRANPANSPSLVSQEASMHAPPDVTLVHLTLWWRGAAFNGGQVAAIASGVTDQVLADYREIEFPPVSASFPTVSYQQSDYDLAGSPAGIRLRSACPNGAGTCQTTVVARLEVRKAALTVVDNDAPRGSVTGALLTDAVLTGTPDITVDATDRGAGLYALNILVDGQLQSSTPFAGWPCSDVDTTDSDAFEFSTVSPCPLKKILNARLDTRLLTDDAYHRVEVQLLDAGGNATTLADRTVGVDSRAYLPGHFDPATRRFQNPSLNLGLGHQLNGRGATSGSRLRVYFPVDRRVRARGGTGRDSHRRITRAVLKRTLGFTARPTMRGVLTDTDRRPIVGAQVWLAVRLAGGEWQLIGAPLTTSQRGRVGLRLPPRTPSRQINLVYFPYTDSHDQTVGQPLHLTVRAGVTLRVTPSTVHNGQRVRFTGRVAGPLAERGATVSMQVKLGQRYRTFRALRVSPVHRGTFRTFYRFKATTRTTRYRFRALVSRQAGLPYERGTSTARTVLVTR
jgi:hypothetical protein